MSNLNGATLGLNKVLLFVKSWSMTCTRLFVSQNSFILYIFSDIHN